MKRLILVTIILASVITVASVNATVIIDPDAFPGGTNITNAFPGVILTTRDGLAPGSNARAVLAMADSHATTGTNVFAQDDGNTTWGNGIFEFLRADFVAGATQVSLDFFANDPQGDKNPQLLAFDSSDSLIDIDSDAFVPDGSFVTLTVSAPNIAYIAAYWDEIDRYENGGLDNLSYESEPIPEPSTLLLLGIGIAGIAGYGIRRKKKA